MHPTYQRGAKHRIFPHSPLLCSSASSVSHTPLVAVSLPLSLPIPSSSSSACPHPLLLPPTPLLLFLLLLASSFGLVLSSSSIVRHCCRFLVVAFLLCRHLRRYTTLVPLSILAASTSTSISRSSSRIAYVRLPSRPRIESLSTVRSGVLLCPAFQHPSPRQRFASLNSFVPQRATHLSCASPPQPSSLVSDKTPLYSLDSLVVPARPNAASSATRLFTKSLVVLFTQIHRAPTPIAPSITQNQHTLISNSCRLHPTPPISHIRQKQRKT